MAASLQSTQVTCTEEELLKVAEYLTPGNCAPLASAWGLDALYITKLQLSPFTHNTPSEILWKWKAANGNQATKQEMCNALEKINRRDLAEAITSQSQSEGEMM